MSTYSTNDENFEIDVLNSSTPTLVDYWAEWCSPCKQIGLILEEIADEKKNVLNVVKLNIDANHKITQKYNIRAIPTLMLFKEGNLISTKVGTMSKSALIEWIDTLLIK